MLDMVEETVEKIQENQEQHESAFFGHVRNSMRAIILTKKDFTDVESAEKGKRTAIFLWGENDFFHVFADVIETDWRSRKKKTEKGNLL